MATGHFGEIDAMCTMAPPEVGVVTAVDAAHLVALGDVDGVAREKASLVARLPADGLAVLNADDPRVAAMATAGPAPGGHLRGRTRVRLPGGRSGADSVGDDRSPATTTGGSERVVVPFLGAHSTGAALAALAVGEPLRHRPGQDAVAAVGRADALPGRLRPLPGRDGSLLLDDTLQRRAPIGARRSATRWPHCPAGARVAVLGDMAELGAAGEELHRAGRAAGGRGGRPAGDPGELGGLDRRRRPKAGLDRRPGGHHVHHRGRRRRGRPATSAPAPWCWSRGARWPGWSGWWSGCWPRASTPPSCWSARTGPGSRSASSSPTARPGWRSTCRRWPTTSAGWPARAPGAEVMVVLKADAYGHGAVQVAHTALRSGAT